MSIPVMDRYSRMRLIGIDIDALHDAECLVVGAGALGNEVVKNMVLAGFGNITIADDDHISTSNLSRCLFFRHNDTRNANKAEIVAKRASELNPGCNIVPVPHRVQEMSIEGYDLILGCMDNILSRLHVNAHACYRRIPYIDGATHGLSGKVQAVLPGRACLQCIMNGTHAAVSERRFSCTGDEVYITPVPSDITTTSVIAGIQVREAMKILSGMGCQDGVCYYDGSAGTMELLKAGIDRECPNHGA